MAQASAEAIPDKTNWPTNSDNARFLEASVAWDGVVDPGLQRRFHLTTVRGPQPGHPELMLQMGIRGPSGWSAPRLSIRLRAARGGAAAVRLRRFRTAKRMP